MQYDVTVHVVLDDFGKLGRAYREVDEANADFETVVSSLIAGQYSCPQRIVAFNTAEGWARDVSEDVAHEVQDRARLEYVELPAATAAFLERELGYGAAALVPVAPWREPASELRAALETVRMALQNYTAIPPSDGTIEGDAEALAEAVSNLGQERDRLAQINAG